MKIAISVPDGIFRAAEAYARRMRKSRNQLYSEAIVEYLAHHSPDEVTAAMDMVVEQLDEPIDPFVTAVAQRTLREVEW